MKRGIAIRKNGISNLKVDVADVDFEASKIIRAGPVSVSSVVKFYLI
jgi:hypothetical protein